MNHLGEQFVLFENTDVPELLRKCALQKSVFSRVRMKLSCEALRNIYSEARFTADL